MSYLNGLLAGDEQVRMLAHRHVIFLLLRTALLVLATLLLWALAIIIYQRVDRFQQALTIGLLALSLAPLGMAIYRFFSWQREQYAITDYRIIQVEGILNKRTFDSSLDKVNDVQMTQGFLGRIFGYGDIEVITGSDVGVNHLHGIADPFRFKRVLQETKLGAHDRDDSVAERQAGSRSAYRPDPNATTAQFTTQSRRDTQQLRAALIDLRDSGILTEEEFEERLQVLDEETD